MNNQAHNLYVMLRATTQSREALENTLFRYKDNVIKELATLFKIKKSSNKEDLINEIINKTQG